MGRHLVRDSGEKAAQGDLDRPGIIFGLAAGNLLNFLGTLGVYAAICKHEGPPFEFPGNQFTWEGFSDVSNSHLCAEQEVWAAIDPRGKNQAFNTINGDVIKWKHVWKSLADQLGMEYIPYSGEPMKLTEIMKDKATVWDKIIEENGLYPLKLEEVGHWWFLEGYLNVTMDYIASANKGKEHASWDFDTEKTFLSFFDQMRDRKLIP